ncbi:MAG: OmpA family protein [Myxococcota bacterium]
MTHGSLLSLSVLVALAPAAAIAAPDASGEASASVSVGGSTRGDATEADPADRKDRPWIRRWTPENGMIEVGLYGGVLLPSPRMELFEADTDLPAQGHKPFATVAPDFGIRASFLPIRFFGVEAEGGAMPTRTTTDEAALLWTARGSLVGQLGIRSVTPFVLVGGGLIGVASERSSVGNDVDASAHFGGGLKIFTSRYTNLRLDVRDIITARRGNNAGVVHNPEVLLGFGVTLGRHKERPVPPPSDIDRDGVPDADDECVDRPGLPELRGCPIPDTDGDGILDPDDECVEEVGVPEYRGCPIPDTDGDGILDPDDECVEEVGVPEYAGCPIPDTDGDGILDPDDKCVEQIESLNGFEDTDGCPDEVPQEVARFTGVIEGIVFATGKATIRNKSHKVLGAALSVLRKYETLRVEITGHTDDRGPQEVNTRLSGRRAEAVKAWLVERGIDESRIVTRGAGPSMPIAPNTSKRGRAKNRRIEFKLLTD